MPACKIIEPKVELDRQTSQCMSTETAVINNDSHGDPSSLHIHVHHPLLIPSLLPSRLPPPILQAFQQEERDLCDHMILHINEKLMVL